MKNPGGKSAFSCGCLTQIAQKSILSDFTSFYLYLHVGVVVCLNGSDDDEIHNDHLVISDKDSIRGFGRSGYLQNFILENVST